MLADSLRVPVGLILNAVGGAPAEAWVARPAVEQDFPDLLDDWYRNDFVQPWVRQRARLNVGQDASPLQRHPYQTGYLFEAGIAPLARYPLRGVAWYQGESNAHNMEAHERIFPLLVQSWRDFWGDGALPFTPSSCPVSTARRGRGFATASGGWPRRCRASTWW